MKLLKFVEENNFELFKENLDIDSIEESDDKKNSILHYCTELGKYDFVDLLLYNGADCNLKNKDGNTPVHIAAKNNFSDIIELLIEFGGDIEIKNNQQRTPVNLAIASKAKDVLKVIENSGVDYKYSAGFEKISHHKRFED